MNLLQAHKIKGAQCVLALALSLAFSSQWSAKQSSGRKTLQKIGVRNAHAMAFDSSRGRVILFGGADATQVRGDTWEWNGQTWLQVSLAGPAPRTFPALTYDSRRKRIVLFGGNRVLFGKNPDENEYLDDTWEWDGQTWIQIKVTGPPPRAEAAIAYDSRRGRVVLFGGHNRIGGVRHWLGDTWEWDGSRWTEIKVAGASPRNGAAAIYDNERGKVVLFGGSSRGIVSGETWEWDGRQWVENRLAATQGRFNSVMAYDGARRKVIRFGGNYRGQRLGDTWEYDGKVWKQLDAAGAAARNHAAMVYDEKRKQVILFGGHDGENVFGDTWTWNGKDWTQHGAGGFQKRIENGH